MLLLSACASNNTESVTPATATSISLSESDEEEEAIQWDNAMTPVHELFATYDISAKGIPDWSYKSQLVEVPIVEPSEEDRSSFESLSVDGIISVTVVDATFTAADIASMRPRVQEVLNAELDELDEKARWEGSTGVHAVFELPAGLEISHGFDRETAVVDLDAFEARIVAEVERLFPDSIVPISFSTEPLTMGAPTPEDMARLTEEGPAE